MQTQTDDDAHPIAMFSGIVLGMALGLVLSAGLPGWRAAATDLCKFAATEAGQNAANVCGPATEPQRVRVYP
ncbi:MAG: hypothetical protein JO128_15155 [Alphaproteobacteria bacterium]|nr:hypothetical protein [Alphaproteobacteria bacterium]